MTNKYSGIDDDVVADIKKFEAAADQLKEVLIPLNKIDRKGLKKYPAYTRAKISMAKAYAVVAMWTMILRARGKPLSESLETMLQRTKDYFTKVEGCMPQAKRVESNRRARVNAAAASRAVKQVISSNKIIEKNKTKEQYEEEEEEVEEIEEIEEVEEIEEELPTTKRAANLVEDLMQPTDSKPSKEKRKRDSQPVQKRSK